MWLLQLRIVVPPGLKPSWLYVPNRSGFCTSFQQGNLGDKNRSKSLVTWAKRSNDAMIMISFLAMYFHNPCFVVYFMLILSSYIKRKSNYFQCAPKHLLMSGFFLRTKRNTCCKSFYSAMIGSCTKWIVLMNQLEKIFNFGIVRNLINILKAITSKAEKEYTLW